MFPIKNQHQSISRLSILNEEHMLDTCEMLMHSSVDKTRHHCAICAFSIHISDGVICMYIYFVVLHLCVMHSIKRKQTRRKKTTTTQNCVHRRYKRVNNWWLNVRRNRISIAPGLAIRSVICVFFFLHPSLSFTALIVQTINIYIYDLILETTKKSKVICKANSFICLAGIYTRCVLCPTKTTQKKTSLYSSSMTISNLWYETHFNHSLTVGNKVCSGLYEYDGRRRSGWILGWGTWSAFMDLLLDQLYTWIISWFYCKKKIFHELHIIQFQELFLTQ